MWGLEYALLFGVPNNKLELLDGRSRCAFPFINREIAETHFVEWMDTLCRWQGLAQRPQVTKTEKEWKADVNGFILTLCPRPIDLRIPIDGEAFLAFYEGFWRRDLWGGQPKGHETGWEDIQRHSDVILNLWSLFKTIRHRYGGASSGQVDLSLSDTAGITPNHYYFRADRAECMIERDFFFGVPDLVVEVLSPATRTIDRGPRKDLYRREGVPHLWLLDPEIETVEIYELMGNRYQLVRRYRAGDEFSPSLFPDVIISVDQLFNTQWKRHPEWHGEEEPEPIPAWLVSRETRLGLQHLLLLGHPERRFEIWDNRAPCVLPFGSEDEARLRFQHFLEDLCRWEQASMAEPSSLEPNVEVAEVGRFRLTRRGRHVHLDVAVDAKKYRALLQVWAQHEAWDWGED